jgi:hypothetical protein
VYVVDGNYTTEKGYFHHRSSAPGGCNPFQIETPEEMRNLSPQRRDAIEVVDVRNGYTRKNGLLDVGSKFDFVGLAVIECRHSYPFEQLMASAIARPVSR